MDWYLLSAAGSLTVGAVTMITLTRSTAPQFRRVRGLQWLTWAMAVGCGSTTGLAVQLGRGPIAVVSWLFATLVCLLAVVMTYWFRARVRQVHRTQAAHEQLLRQIAAHRARRAAAGSN